MSLVRPYTIHLAAVSWSAYLQVVGEVTKQAFFALLIVSNNMASGLAHSKICHFSIDMIRFVTPEMITRVS